MPGNRAPTLVSLMAIDRFVEATRDSGYKGTGSAVSELVDNSIQANAHQIQINVKQDRSTPDSITISVFDNGCGMDPFTLRQALQFGGSSRFNDRSGIGRYGMGLPNSSLSQARCVYVYSWQSISKMYRTKPTVYGTYLDLDEIIAGRMTHISAPKVQKCPPTQCTGKSGTLVVWSRCDRLDNRRISTIIRKLKYDLGRRFRHYLSRGTQIFINDEPIRPIDPLFLNSRAIYCGARQYGNELAYEISTDSTNPDAPTGEVRVRFSELPVDRWRGWTNEEKRQSGVSNGAGISVVRADREVDFGWFLMGSKRKENYDDWWRCEIAFDPILDEAFGITHTKQQIQPATYLSEILSPDLEEIARKLNNRARKAHQFAAPSLTTKPSADIATKREKRFAPLPSAVNPDTRRTMKRIQKVRRLAPRGQSAFEYQIVPTDGSTTAFFSFGMSKRMLALALNQEHPFFREFSRLESNSAKNKKQHFERLLELLLLSAARSEAVESQSSRRKIIEQFRSRWSDILAVYING